MKYPIARLNRRVVSSATDGLIILATFLAAAYFVPPGLENSGLIKACIGAGMLFLYVPAFTAFACTAGHFITGIRVRRVSQLDERISLPAAFLRALVKWLLGWISFLWIFTNKKNRALHDYLSSSVVLQYR